MFNQRGVFSGYLPGPVPSDLLPHITATDDKFGRDVSLRGINETYASTINSTENQAPIRPGYLNALAEGNSLFKNATFLEADAYSQKFQSEESESHKIQSTDISDPEIGYMNVGHLAIVKKKGDPKKKTPYQSSFFNLRGTGYDGLIIDSNRYFVLSVHGFNAWMATLPYSEYTVTDELSPIERDAEGKPQFVPRFLSAEEIWEQWCVYGVVNSFSPTAATRFGIENPNMPTTLTGKGKTMGVIYAGIADIVNYWEQNVNAGQDLYLILKKVPKKEHYKVSTLENSYVFAGDVKKPFALTFYADPLGRSNLPPRGEYYYVDEDGKEKPGVVIKIGTTKYSYLKHGSRHSQYQTNNAIPSVLAEKLHIDVQINSVL